MYEIGHRGGRLPPTCFPQGYDQSDLTDISQMTDSWAKFMNTRTGEVVDCAEFAAQMNKLTYFVCMPKCDHVYDRWEDFPDGGGSMVCSKCGTTAMQEDMWG